MGSYSLTKKGVSSFDWADPYGMAVRLTWPRFLASILLVYVAFTASSPSPIPWAPSVANSRPGVFTDHFFFSLETLATVGYGEMYPATFYGHCVATAEILTGVALQRHPDRLDLRPLLQTARQVRLRRSSGRSPRITARPR